MTTHTPGPWTIDLESPEVTMVYAVENGQTRPVASVHWSEANARLIAAAPELAAELREALRLLERAATDEARANKAPTGLAPRTVARERWERARALLAKIEGA